MDLKAAKLKYLQLGVEILNYTSGDVYGNLMHTHSKLGIFLQDVLGDAWRYADKGGEEEQAPA